MTQITFFETLRPGQGEFDHHNPVTWVTGSFGLYSCGLLTYFQMCDYLKISHSDDDMEMVNEDWIRVRDSRPQYRLEFINLLDQLGNMVEATYRCPATPDTILDTRAKIEAVYKSLASKSNLSLPR